jgi:hypothetical protein
MDGVDSIREVLSGDTIDFEKLDDAAGIFAHVDVFVNLSRENKTVEEVILCVDTDPDAHRYAVWDKIAEGIGNLQALREIIIADGNFADDEEDPQAPDWEILACILRRLPLGVQLRICDDTLMLWNTEALPAFARAIHGHAMITGFITGSGFPFHCLDFLCSALLTLPALEFVSFEQLDGQGPEEEQSLESMIELLQLPSLREVLFRYVVFTNTLSRAVAKALKERSGITDLHFSSCSFPEDETVFCEVLAPALLSNSTLKRLEFYYGSGGCSFLSQLFLALQVNVGLKTLKIYGFELIDENLSTAMRLGLGKNSMLQYLSLSNIKSGDNDTCLWREALSLLRTNATLKTLYMAFEKNVTESHATAIRMEVAAALRENESLETLSMTSLDAGLEDYLACVDAIHPNTALKSLELRYVPPGVDDDEMKDLIPVLKKNYGLEEIRGLRLGAGDVNSILQLNRAGRRYLIEDGSSILKGVAVLSRVSNDINSVFFHLLENPRLCDRSAVEMSSTSIGHMNNTGSTSPGNRHSGDKRQQEEASQLVKETRMRLE